MLVDGNDKGVAGITLVVQATDSALGRRGFARLVGGVPPLTSAPQLTDTLVSWTGPQQSWEVDGIRVTAVCDVTQCIVFVVTAASPLLPLPLR